MLLSRQLKMSAPLAAIPTDRAAVRAAVFAIKDFDGALGTWSFDANGDTSLTDMTFYQVQRWCLRTRRYIQVVNLS